MRIIIAISVSQETLISVGATIRIISAASVVEVCGSKKVWLSRFQDSTAVYVPYHLLFFYKCSSVPPNKVLTWQKRELVGSSAQLLRPECNTKAGQLSWSLLLSSLLSWSWLLRNLCYAVPQDPLQTSWFLMPIYQNYFVFRCIYYFDRDPFEIVL